MDEQAKKDLSLYRLELAESSIHSAEVLMECGEYRDAASRSYYAIFHSMRAILALDGRDFSKHSAVSSYFRHDYVKEKIFDVRMSDIVKEAFDMRGSSDYDDFYVVSKTEIKTQIENAKFFYDEVKRYIENRI